MISRRAASEFPNDNPELHDGLVWACPETSGRALPTLRVRPPKGVLPRVLGPAWEMADEPPAPSPLPERSVPPARPARSLESLEPLEPFTLETRDAAPDLAPLPATELGISEPELAEPAPLPTADLCVSEPELAELAPLPAPDPPVSEPAPEGPFERFIAALARVAMAHGATRAGAAVSTLLTDGRFGVHGVDPLLLEALVRRRILAPGSGHVTAEFAAATRAWRAVLEGTDADLSACGSATLDAWASELLALVMSSPHEAAELRRELRRAGVAAFGLLAVA